MIRHVRLSRSAERDLLRLNLFLSTKSPSAARKALERVAAGLKSLESFAERVSACAVAFVLMTSAVFAAPTPGAEALRSAEHVKAHMAFLASDLLEGRETGARGADIAAEYIASQYRQLGLTPAGEGGTYFQRVPLLAYRASGTGALILHPRDGASIPLIFGEDYLPGHNPVAGEVRVSGALVFVGYGVVAPERGRDDYKGLEVRGKIVVALSGAPAGIQSEERAYYASGRTKRLEAARHGAVGYLQLSLPEQERRRPFSDGLRTWDAWAMTWRLPDGAPFDVAPGVPSLGALSVKGAAKLFAGAPSNFDEVVAAAVGPAEAPPRFDLAVSITANVSGETKAVESRNVAGLLPGADRLLKAEVVVLSAHLDHLGLTRPIEGDAINNGALDNAAGIATTLEVARSFVESGKRPRRSILFLADTGEEKGLLGSEYFARNPTVPLASIVADVDLDMPILTYDFIDVVAFGADRSDIGVAVRRAAGRLGIGLSADPLPEQGLFIRSDHYRFVEVGIPAVFLMTGFANGGEAQYRSFLAHCYHRPCDDLSQPIDYLAGAKFARLNYELTRELSDMPKRPAWNPGDFFGEKYRSGAQRQP